MGKKDWTLPPQDLDYITDEKMAMGFFLGHLIVHLGRKKLLGVSEINRLLALAERWIELSFDE